MAAKKPKRLMVAVDFGTTFSSMAFALSQKNEEPEVVSWWGDDVFTAHEVPTIVQYEPGVLIGNGRYKWGLQVNREDNDRPVHEWFKLRLYPRIEKGLLKKYPSKAPKIDDEDCKKLVVDFLKAVRKNFEALLKQKDAMLEKVPREYIITVPAIWEDKAKDITRKCAIDAGMGGYDIHIIKEPEAAGVYALDTHKNHGLEVGDTFVICDAGGGTVDLVSYTVKSLKPTTLVEAAEGSGGLCGSSFLNRAFEAYLDKKFRNIRRFYDAGYKTQVMQYFETSIKPLYGGQTNDPYRIPVRGLGLSDDDNDRLRIVNERLLVPHSDLEPIFKEVVREVITLVEEQITSTKKKVRSVVLVGGFGESPYLRTNLKAHLKDVQRGVQLIRINEGKLAVVRGALMTGLTLVDKTLPYPRPDGRIPTKSYGFAQWVDFDLSEGHDPNRKEYDPNKRKHKIETMRWCIVQGSLVKESAPQPKIGLCAFKAKDDGPSFKPMEIPVYTYKRSREGEEPPQYKTSDLRKIVTLKARLDRIPPDKLRVEDQCYVADFDVETVLNSAGFLTFNLIVDGMKVPGESVETDFE